MRLAKIITFWPGTRDFTDVENLPAEDEDLRDNTNKLPPKSSESSTWAPSFSSGYNASVIASSTCSGDVGLSESANGGSGGRDELLEALALGLDFGVSLTCTSRTGDAACREPVVQGLFSLRDSTLVP